MYIQFYIDKRHFSTLHSNFKHKGQFQMADDQSSYLLDWHKVAQIVTRLNNIMYCDCVLYNIMFFFSS